MASTRATSSRISPPILILMLVLPSARVMVMRTLRASLVVPVAMVNGSSKGMFRGSTVMERMMVRDICLPFLVFEPDPHKFTLLGFFKAAASHLLTGSHKGPYRASAPPLPLREFRPKTSSKNHRCRTLTGGATDFSGWCDYVVYRRS